MATAATMTTNTKQRPRLKRRTGQLHLVDDRGQQIPEAVLFSVSDRFHARQLQARLERTIKRHEGTPERQSIAIAMLAVEKAIVEAYWVLGRSTSVPGPRQACQHGVDYLLEREDKWGAAVANSGWLTDPDAPPPPTATEIDSMYAPLEWLQLLEPMQREIVSAGARSKQGDVDRRISWERVKKMYPKFDDWLPKKLHRVYSEGLRVIVMVTGRE